VLFTSVTSFTPLFLVDHFGVTEATAAASLAIIYSGGLWVSPLGGYLSDRVGRVPMVLAVCFITGPIIFLLNLAPYGLGTGAVLVLLGVALYARMPASEAYIVGQTSEHNRSTILGIYYFSMNEGGGILTPVMGYLIDQLGFYYSFTIASAFVVVVTLVCSIWLWGSRD
jgi:MFS family permease